jgi:hypothetical protein
VSTCRSCDAEVIFLPSAKTGKPMILDAKPTKGVVLQRPPLRELEDGTPDLTTQPWVGAVVDIYTDHHVTCPKAKEWQGRTRKNPPVEAAP